MVLANNSEHELRHSITQLYIEGAIEKLNVDQFFKIYHVAAYCLPVCDMNIILNGHQTESPAKLQNNCIKKNASFVASGTLES